jgi:hypothetical protein
MDNCKKLQEERHLAEEQLLSSEGQMLRTLNEADKPALKRQIEYYQERLYDLEQRIERDCNQAAQSVRPERLTPPEPQQYHDIHLQITAHAVGYAVYVDGAWSGALSAESASLPISSEADAINEGRKLYGQCFPNGLMLPAPMNNVRMRILVEIEPDAHPAHDLPWECLHDGSGFLSIYREIAIIRLIDAQPTPILSQAPLRVLLTCSGEGAELFQPIRGALERISLKYLSLLSLKTNRDVTLNRLRQDFKNANDAGESFHLWIHLGGLTIGGYPPNPDTFAGIIPPSLRAALIHTYTPMESAALPNTLTSLTTAQNVQPVFTQDFTTWLLSKPIDEAHQRALASAAPHAGNGLLLAQTRLFSRTRSPRLLA